MYGPPPDPRQLIAPTGFADEPLAWLACIALGLLLSGAALAIRRAPVTLRALAFITGQVTALTVPLVWNIDRYVYGSFPTIDKEGSLLFYADGVHIRMVTDPMASLSDPAAALIGVHVGHLWLSQALDLVLSPIGAFNAQGLLYIVLGWLCAWVLLREVSKDDAVAMILSMPYGMGLHVFRDLNWYTIEKAATFFVPLYMWTFWRAHERGGKWIALPALCFLVMCWINLYLGLTCGLFAAMVVAWQASGAVKARKLTEGLRRCFLAAAASAIAAMPIMLWQHALMDGGPQLATPEEFLWQRAALDGFSLVPLRWNRLELYAALSPLALALAALGAVKMRRERGVQLAMAVGGVMFLLSIGPALLPGPPVVINPVYMAAREVVPGFWRVAKPEVFFQVTWTLILAIAALQLVAMRPGRRVLGVLYGLTVVGWVVFVRGHDVYPPMTVAVESALAPGWEQGVFQED